MEGCPSSADRDLYAAGAADPAQAARLEEHAAACESCRGWLQESRADERLLEQLRRLPEPRPDAGPTPAAAGPTVPEGASLGQYRIVRRIGEGGMGVVYEAEQKRPRRAVALKVLRPGFLSDRLLRRFEFEAEVLARLDHPAIARILEAGTFGSGPTRQPFFAMELVRGRPLDEWVSRENPSIERRLELFRVLCDAVAHAHRRGVIHRDLKPANILITESGTPKVLDFGIARATDSDLQAPTLETGLGQIVGTLPYMSPEQVAGDSDRLDVRSDVYSLGVNLYEMLTGERPYDLSGRALAQSLRVIQEATPRAPSSLRAALARDLDTIALKALEKDPERRYGSVQELADDVARFARHEPIAARPPSTIYHLRKFARRNRALVGAAIGLLLALVGGIATTGFQWWRAERATTAAERAGGEAKRAQAAAEEEAATARAISDFLMKVVIQGSPDQRESGVTTVDEAFAVAARRVDSEFADRPLVRAELHHTIGWTLHRMGATDEAERHLKAARELRVELLGPEHLQVAQSIAAMGQLEMSRGNPAAAERLLRQAWEMRERLGETDLIILGANLSVLASSVYLQGRFEESARLNERALQFKRRHAKERPLDLVTVLGNLAFALARAQAAPDRIDRLQEEAIELARGASDRFHDQVVDCLATQAQLYLERGRLERAEAVVGEAAAIDRKARGIVSGSVLEVSRRVLEAVRAQEADARAEAAPGRLAPLLARKAALLSIHGEEAKAEEAAAEAEDRWLEAIAAATASGAEREAGALRSRYGRFLLDRGHAEDAEPVLVDALAALEAAGTGDATLDAVLLDLARLHESRGESEQAEAYRRQRRAAPAQR